MTWQSGWHGLGANHAMGLAPIFAPLLRPLGLGEFEAEHGGRPTRGLWCRLGGRHGGGRVSRRSGDLYGDAGAVVDDLARGVEEAALGSVGCGVGVDAGHAEGNAASGALGQDAQDEVEVDGPRRLGRPW